MKNLQKFVILFFGVYSLFFVLVGVLAPVFAKIGLYEVAAKFYAELMYACHQQPHLSFWFMGYPMAICCRCLGFYIGVVIISTLVLINKFKLEFKIFVVLLLVTLTDLSLNYLLHINTGKIVRFIIGFIMAVLFVSILNYRKMEGEKC